MLSEWFWMLGDSTKFVRVAFRTINKTYPNLRVRSFKRGPKYLILTEIVKICPILIIQNRDSNNHWNGSQHTPTVFGVNGSVFFWKDTPTPLYSAEMLTKNTLGTLWKNRHLMSFVPEHKVVYNWRQSAKTVGFLMFATVPGVYGVFCLCQESGEN